MTFSTNQSNIGVEKYKHAKKAKKRSNHNNSISYEYTRSIPATGLGGLRISNTSDFSLISEEIDISEFLIKVRYIIRNNTNRKLQNEFSLPLQNYIYNDENKPNQEWGERLHEEIFWSSPKLYINQTLLDKKKIIKRSFVVDEVDISENLRKIGLIDSQIYSESFLCTKFLNYMIWYGINNETLGKEECKVNDKQEEEINKLVKNKLPIIKEWLSLEHYFEPHQELDITLEYAPQRGVTNVRSGSENQISCLDQIEPPVLINKIKDKDLLAYVQVIYLFDIERKFNKPIGKFNIKIHKQNPEDAIGLCFPIQVKSINTTTYEYKTENFLPEKNIDLTYITDPIQTSP